MRQPARRVNRRPRQSITPQFINRRNILPGVPYQIKRRDNQRNHSPRPQQQILPRKLPIMSVDARLAQIAVNLKFPSRQQHAHIAVKFHILGRPRTTAPLAKPRCEPRRLQVRRRHRRLPQGLAKRTNSPPGSITKSSKQESNPRWAARHKRGHRRPRKIPKLTSSWPP